MKVHLTKPFLDRTWLELNPDPLVEQKGRSLGALALTQVEDAEKYEIERIVVDKEDGWVDVYLRPKTYRVPEQNLEIKNLF